jgi:hypothetical protein
MIIIYLPFLATLILSGTQYPTINKAYHAMTCIQKTLNKCLDGLTSQAHLIEMIGPMKEKFDKYWGPMKELAAIGLVLNPQYKMRYLCFNLEQQALPSEEVNMFVGTVRSSLLDLWKMYVPPQASITNPPKSTPSSSKKVNQDTSAFLQYMAGTMGGAQTNAPAAKLDLYLEERNVILTNHNKFNILSWWKGNSA